MGKVGPSPTTVPVGSVVLGTVSLLAMRKYKFGEGHRSLKAAGLGERTDIKFRPACPHAFFLCFGAALSGFLVYPVLKTHKPPRVLGLKRNLFRLRVCTPNWQQRPELFSSIPASLFHQSRQHPHLSGEKQFFILITPFLLISSNIYTKIIKRGSYNLPSM